MFAGIVLVVSGRSLCFVLSVGGVFAGFFCLCFCPLSHHASEADILDFGCFKAYDEL